METGGWIPEGFLTEGPTRGSRASRPELGERFGLREAPLGPSHMGDDYQGETWMYDYFKSNPWGPRTVANAAESDGTLWIGNTTSAGYHLTRKGVEAANKHMFFVSLPNIDNPETRQKFMEWLAEYDIRTLNIAGNRLSTDAAIEGETRRFLNETLGGTPEGAAVPEGTLDDPLSADDAAQREAYEEERIIEEPSDDLGEEMDWVEKDALAREEADKAELLSALATEDADRLASVIRNDDGLDLFEYWKAVANESGYTDSIIGSEAWKDDLWNDDLVDSAEGLYIHLREKTGPIQQHFQSPEMHEIFQTIRDFASKRLDELERTAPVGELLPAPDPVPMLKDAKVEHHSAAINDIDVNDLNAHIEEMVPTNLPPEGTIGGYPTGGWWPSHLGYNKNRIPQSGPIKHPDTHIQGDEGTTYYYTNAMFSEASGDVQPWSPMIRDIKERVEEITGYDFDLVLIQRYPTGRTDLGWHSDLAQQRDPVTGETMRSTVNPLTGKKDPVEVVVSVNFGATRSFGFRRIGFTGTQQPPAVAKSIYREEVAAANRREAARGQGAVELGNGDILVMMEGPNTNYQHSILRDPDLVGEGGLRINMTFRQLDPDLIAAPRRQVGPYAEVSQRKTRLPMNFDYGKRGALPKAENVTSDNTFNAILAGERTATSRTNQGGQLDGVEVGDVIHLTRGDRSIRVRVTEKRLAGEISPQEWAALEGYDATAATRDWSTGKMYSRYVQIEFELIDLPSGPR